jgi:predicted alpha/beta hydrolase family esterase
MMTDTQFSDAAGGRGPRADAAGDPASRPGAGRSATPCLIVPGLSSSGPDHWQTLWENGRDDCHRVETGCWDDPLRDRWVAGIDVAVRAAPGRPIFVAHSLGCLAVAWWAEGIGRDQVDRIGGALLVAPPDVDRPGVDVRLERFAPTPSAVLPFPTILVASRDDPYASIERSRAMADDWGAAFVDAGRQGHLNAQSQLGSWLIGQRLLDRLIDLAGNPARVAAPRSQTRESVYR